MLIIFNYAIYIYIVREEAGGIIFNYAIII